MNRNVRSRLKSKLVSYVLAACATGAYIGILTGGKIARDHVVDTVAYGARLASDGHAAANTMFDTKTGSATIGISNRSPSRASWEIAPLGRNASSRRWLCVTADAPSFSGPSGLVTVTVDSATVGIIRASNGSGFVADRKQEVILVPPARTLGYRFALEDARSCSDSPCDVTVRGIATSWPVYRFTIVGEDPRFVAHADR